MSKDIARKIETELAYPGQVRGRGDPRDPRVRLREVSVGGTASPLRDPPRREPGPEVLDGQVSGGQSP